MLLNWFGIYSFDKISDLEFLLATSTKFYASPKKKKVETLEFNFLRSFYTYGKSTDSGSNKSRLIKFPKQNKASFLFEQFKLIDSL